jgi:predicted DNA binding protein
MDASGTTSKLLIHLPDKLWIGELSRKFRMYAFEIISFIPISQEPFVGNSLIKITGTRPAQLLMHLDNHPSLKAYFVMEETPTQLTINTQTKDQYLLEAIVKHHIIIKFPVPVEDGIATFQINSTRENVDAFIDALNMKGIKTELKSVGGYTNEDVDERELTPRQQEIYKRAKDSGYYDSPRRVSLTDLAEQIGMAKSSLSSLLQRIHKKLLGS